MSVERRDQRSVVHARVSHAVGTGIEDKLFDPESDSVCDHVRRSLPILHAADGRGRGCTTLMAILLGGARYTMLEWMPI
jgi:hypothetical protein